MKLSQAIDGYMLSMRADSMSENTLNGYAIHLAQMVDYLQDPLIEVVTPLDLTKLMAYLRTDYKPKRLNGSEEPYKPSTLKNAWCAVRSFWRWAAETLELKRPDLTLKRPRGETPIVSPFTADEVKAILKAAETTRPSQPANRKAYSAKRPTGPRDMAIVLVLLDTGLRVSELTRLNVGDVALDTGQITVRPYGTGQKTKTRLVYLGKSARRAVWKYLTARPDVDRSEPLFLSDDGHRMTRMAVRLMLNRLGERVGVKCYPHRFRHTFAITYLRNGGDTFTLQRLLGHSTLDMTRKYVALADADAATAHRQASPVDRWQL